MDSSSLVDTEAFPRQVKNSEARRGGLDVSLFKLLSDHHTEAVVDLSYQYRMNADIMSLSNTLIYNNRLKCGTEIVANQSLELSEGNIHDCKSDSCWISHALQPRSVDRSAYERNLTPLQCENHFS